VRGIPSAWDSRGVVSDPEEGRVIRCPRCGSDTAVGETRPAPAGTRRRRHCIDLSCDGKVTTYEMVFHGTRVRQPVVIDGSDLETIKRLASLALGDNQ
jgi:hypothetical protein